jgi:hypothetical protein
MRAGTSHTTRTLSAIKPEIYDMPRIRAGQKKIKNTRIILPKERKIFYCYMIEINYRILDKKEEINIIEL